MDSEPLRSVHYIDTNTLFLEDGCSVPSQFMCGALNCKQGEAGEPLGHFIESWSLRALRLDLGGFKGTVMEFKGWKGLMINSTWRAVTDTV